MTLPPLRTGICTIGPLRFPAIVGKVEGETREIFICGQHIDRFITEQMRKGVIRTEWQVRIDAAVNGREL